ncbi:hypothetical protein LOC67_22715 [Stieleria sp. JC731]|uniref:hypothetical protein n=1 Tax=Stieleria sp. JC731 TaxID=2894195 RepID=UPI001E581602|nr:hypothetical protein [Stieleria sp. JC731]MCC9603372.1 hypothetical protein [Stieleria sp. JC731]
MSVRKLRLAAECQHHALEHIIVDGEDRALSTRDLNSLRTYCDERVLTLRGIHAESLAFLNEWKELRGLKVYACKVANWDVLATLPHLKDLWYHTNRDKTPDLSFLSRLTQLETLGIGYVTHLKEFPNLSHCKRLKKLTIFTCNRLCDVESVVHIPKLQSFSIVGTPLVPADLQEIMAMRSLKTISGAFGSKTRDSEFRQLLAEHGLKYG